MNDDKLRKIIKYAIQLGQLNTLVAMSVGQDCTVLERDIELALSFARLVEVLDD